ncbi:MAG: YihY/virulence factor BrkB family protein [Solirubrobacteraceae bacterium]
MSAVGRLDRYQRRHKWLGLPLAVIYKYVDDRGSFLAALISYYSFVSLFPLLLLLYSVLGFVLQGHPGIRHDIVHSVLTNFPVIGPQLSANIASFQGSGVALAIGVLGTLYGALGAMQAAQVGFNQMYGVPRNRQPNPISSRVRSVGLLALLGTWILVSTGISVILSTANEISHEIGPAVKVAGYLVNFVVNVGLFSVAFRLLTAREFRLRRVLTGGMVAAALWMLVQGFGSAFISHTFKHTDHLYGVFAIVLVTLAWIYLQAVILIVSAELNVVLEYRLWPRSLLTPFTDNVELTDADRRAYRLYAKTQRFKGFETVTAEFKPMAEPPPPDPVAEPPPPDPSQGEEARPRQPDDAAKRPVSP